MTDLPIVPFSTRGAWEAFLEERHATSDGLWIKIAKKGSGIESVTYAQAVEVALCYGWIDGQARKFDEDHYLQRFTPRRPRSRWSKVNREKAIGLMERGEMRAAGLREVERARADGRWDAAYDPPSTAAVPEDLVRELEKNERAARSSPGSTEGTGTPSCTRSRTPGGPRRGRGASRSTWPCWPRERSPTPETPRGTPVAAHRRRPEQTNPSAGCWHRWREARLRLWQEGKEPESALCSGVEHRIPALDLGPWHDGAQGKATDPGG